MEKKHNALGKGLSALIPVRTKEVTTREGYFICPIAKISVNKHQPRKAFSDRTIEELAQSIQANGILQPLVVKPDGSNFELIAGERRLRAAKKAGLKEVPVIIAHLNNWKPVRLIGSTEDLLVAALRSTKLMKKDTPAPALV